MDIPTHQPDPDQIWQAVHAQADNSLVSLVSLQALYDAGYDQVQVQYQLAVTQPDIGFSTLVIGIVPPSGNPEQPSDFSATSLLGPTHTNDILSTAGVYFSGRWATYSGQTLMIEIGGQVLQDGNTISFGPFQTTVFVSSKR